jgi:Zn-dependent protease with chaperone function
MKFEPRYVEENVNVPEQHPFLEFIRLSLLLLGILFAVYVLLGFAAEKIAERLPTSVEAALADSFAGQLDYQAFPRTRSYVQQILDRLVKRSHLTGLHWQVSVQESEEINAIALPGGHIVIFTGMLAAVTSENELAMVLAHELGHYAHRDHLRSLGRGLVALSLVAVLGISGDLPSFIAPSLQTVSLAYSREQEAAADLFALDLVAQTYGHVGGALALFQLFAKQEHHIPAFLSTHPDAVWRLQAANTHISQKNYAQGVVTALPELGKLPFANDR